MCWIDFKPLTVIRVKNSSCCRSFSLSTKQKAGVDPGKLLHASLLFMLPSGLVLISCGSLPLSSFAFDANWCSSRKQGRLGPRAVLVHENWLCMITPTHHLVTSPNDLNLFD
ncbi:hypothetical protein OUZ56_023261 [Daphnia magna]|uniref:Uncharacterized protein n=1 Tax=Daphnia magna TaxID=35525 RepID=A0ABR0AYU8_9CRUS|nr:hypothetical protein OUZ56_023261 [Daphnia magna]